MCYFIKPFQVMQRQSVVSCLYGDGWWGYDFWTFWGGFIWWAVQIVGDASSVVIPSFRFAALGRVFVFSFVEFECCVAASAYVCSPFELLGHDPACGI